MLAITETLYSSQGLQGSPKKMTGHHDDSTWIMVMLIIWQDFTNAGLPIRTWYGQEGH